MMKRKSRLIVEVDKQSGFCFGVVNAINQAEKHLKDGEKLYCLGQIVHNNEEVERLKKLGLVTITHDKYITLKEEKVMLRAHGEPPLTYKQAVENDILLIDASCPVVLKLQVKVRDGWERMKRVDGQIVIFGKKGHAEIVGLIGQTNGEAIIVENIDNIDTIDFTKPIELFAQTTKSTQDYKILASEIEDRVKKVNKGNVDMLTVHNTICGQVANRKTELSSFASRLDVVIFVSGKNSSNGKMLYDVCKSINPNAHFISAETEIKPLWFDNFTTVGICGATSTPLWLMEKVAGSIREI